MKMESVKRSYLDFIDEVLILIIGIFIFVYFLDYRIFFVILVILWYWFKIRYYERKILQKKDGIYNIYFKHSKNCDIPKELSNRRIEGERMPMKHDLKQLENKRKFLVDKFIIVNLIMIVLIEIFIN
jgi:hypothetical protein